MIVETHLTQRREIVARMVHQICSKKGPLSAAERNTLNQLTSEMKGMEDRIQTDAESKRDSAFVSFLRHGFVAGPRQQGITDAERTLLMRDMGSSGQGAFPGTTSGFFVPVGFAGQVFSAMTNIGPVFRSSTVIDTEDGRLLPFPTDNDTTISGERLGESQQTIEADISDISQVMLSSYHYSSKLVRISIELAMDAGFDLGAYLATRLGIRLARVVNYDLTLGTGATGQPLGLTNAVQEGAQAAGSSSNDGSSATTNTIGSDDLTNLIESVDSVYRDRETAGFWMNDSTLSSIKKLKDKDGRPLHLFKSRFNNPNGVDTLCGFPVYVNPNMAQLQVNPSSPPVTNSTVLFGDLASFVVRRTGLRVQRLDEKYSDFGQIGFLCFIRCDGNLIDGGGGAIKSLTNTY